MISIPQNSSAVKFSPPLLSSRQSDRRARLAKAQATSQRDFFDAASDTSRKLFVTPPLDSHPMKNASLPLAARCPISALCMAGLVALLALAHPAQAQTTSAWTGTSNSTWGTAGNWAGGVPSSTVSALFNGTFSNQPTLLATGTSQGVWLATGVGQDVTIDAATVRNLVITGNANLNGQTTAGIYMNDSGNHNLTIGPNTTIALGANTGFYNQQSSGTLTISGGVNIGSRTLTIGNGSTSTGNVTISGNFTTAAGSVTINSGGTVTLSGNNSYTGITTLSAGTLVLNSSGSAGTSSAIGTGTLTIAGGTIDNTSGSPVTLSTNNAQNWNANFAFTGTNDLNLGTGNVAMSATRTVTVNGGNLTVGGVISGTNYGLSKNGTGTLILSGANTYSGTTTINSGTIVAGSGTAFGNGTFDFRGGTLQALMDLTDSNALKVNNMTINANSFVSGANSMTISGNSTGFLLNDYSLTNNLASGKLLLFTGDLNLKSSGSQRTLTIAGSGNTTFSGTLSDTGSTTKTSGITVTSTGTTILSGAFTSNGIITMNSATGTLLLSGNNTSTGGVTLTTGTLAINNNNALGATGANFTITAGTIDSTVAGISIANGNPIAINGNFAFGGTNDLNLGAGAITSALGRTITLNGTGKTLTMGGVWGNSNDSNYTLTVNGAGNTLVLGGIALVNVGSNARTQTIAGSGNVMVTGAVTNGASTGATQGLTVTSTGTVTLQGNNTYNGLTTMNSATGTLVLSGSNSGTGGVTLTAGTLSISSDDNLSGSSSPLVFNGGTLSITGTVLTSLNANRSTTFTAAKTVGFNIADANNNFTVSQNLTQTTGGLNKAGLGTLILTGNNTYTGATTISAGTLEIAGTGLLGGGNYAGTISNNGTLLIGSNSDQTFTGSISGSGALIKSGTGNLTFATSTNVGNYTGATLIQAGTLAISQSQNNLSSSRFTIASTGTVTTAFGGGRDLTIGSLDGSGAFILKGTLTLGGDNTIDANFSGNITTGGTSNLTKVGTGTQTLSGANTYTGTTTINAGTLQIGNGGTTGSISTSSAITNNGTLVFNRADNYGDTYSNSINGTGVLNLAAGNLTLSGANTYTGETQINAGTLQIGSGGTTGSLSTSSAISNNGTLAFNRSNTITQGTDFASVISGTGALLKAGSGNLILTGANTYTGATTINAGTLQLGSGSTTGSLSSSSAITNNGTLTFNRSDNYGGTFSNTINGTGALRLSAGTLTLSGNNTYTGTTTISSGTLEIASTGRLGGGNYTGAISNSGTLLIGSSSTQILSGALSGSGSLIKSGSGDLQINSASTNFSGPTWIQGGSITVATNYNTPLSRYTIDSTGSLQLTGGGGRNLSIGSLVGNGTVNLKGSLTLGGDNTDADFGGQINSLAGGQATNLIIKNGTGTQTLSGATNNQWGNRINEGTLRVGNSGALGVGTMTANATLDLNGHSASVTALSGNATGLITSSSVGAITLTTNSTANSEFAGVIENGSANSLSLTKNGTGTLTLSGNNTYTGSTIVNSGTLAATSAGALGGTTQISVNSGTLLVTASNALNDNAAVFLGGGTFALNGTLNESVGALTLSSNSVIDLAGFDGTLRFSSVGTWADNATLAIWNWNGINEYGTPVGNGQNNRHIVFTSNSGLDPYLSRISFYSDSGSSFVGNAFAEAFTGGGYEIIAVPEPSTCLYTAIFLAGYALHAIRQRRKKSEDATTSVVMD